MWPTLIIVLPFLLLLPLLGHGAEVTTKIERSNATIDLVGDIDKQTPIQVAAAIKSIRSSTTGRIFLRFDSGGGDIEAAIVIGQLARRNEMFTVVPEGATCASACALIFVGGVSRTLILGRYGIHRPYAIRYNESEADSRRSFERINSAVREYLSTMNISLRLLEAMNLVSPGEIKWLTKVEREELGVQGTDPVWEDKTDSAYAKQLGISKPDYYKRRQYAEGVCLSDLRMPMVEKLRCYQDIVEGKIK